MRYFDVPKTVHFCQFCFQSLIGDQLNIEEQNSPHVCIGETC